MKSLKDLNKIIEKLNLELINDSLKKEIIRVQEVFNDSPNEHEKDVILDRLEKIYYTEKQRNSPIIRYEMVEFFKTKSNLSKRLRKMYENSIQWNEIKPNKIWQIVDLSLFQFEIDLNATLREEIDVFWIEKFEDYFSQHSINWSSRIDEFVDFFNISQGSNDYFLVEKEIKYYQSGYNQGVESNEVDFFIYKEDEGLIPLEKAESLLLDFFIDEISKFNKEFKSFLVKNYAELDLMDELNISPDFKKEFYKWYNWNID